ncbi:hypothetical protein KR044_002233, partial [Drosophila immigrans]
IEMSKNDKRNSSGGQRPGAVASHCRILLEQLVVFIIFFSLSVLFMLSLFSLLTDLGIRKPLTYRSALPSKFCSWPSEWCRFFNQAEMSRRPFTLDT